MLEYRLPTYDQFMQPTMDSLHALGGQATNQQIYEWIMGQMDFPDEIVKKPHKPNGALTEVEYRMMWARTYLRKVGLIDSPTRSVWILTDTGEATQQIDAAEIVRQVKVNYRADRQAGKYLEGHAIQTNSSGEAQWIQNPQPSSAISLTPDFPRYSEVRRFLKIMDGQSYAVYRKMANEIWGQIGSPQEQVDWTKPDEWISTRLQEDSASLANEIWHESQQKINPRYTRGPWLFATRHDLLNRHGADKLEISSRGQEFIASPLDGLEAEIDQIEGVLLILRLVAEKGPAKRGDLLGEFAEYCRAHTTIQSESVIKDFLYSRLRNLLDRTLVVSSGQQYEITESGLRYLKEFAEFIPGTREQNRQEANIHALAKQLRDNARDELQAYLFQMNPFKFESLIKLLLEEIGYTNVVTTSPTNDKGVDVIANIELGISSVREVVQVKRHRGSINRIVLDQLRGSLHRFDAVRGTIITTGHFSKGAQEAAFERGAAPITLIDGDKVLELLMQNEIGVKKSSVVYYEFTPDDLTQFADDQEEEI